MANLRLLALIVFLSILTLGCATPPGKLTESDFVSREIVLDIPVSKAHKQLLEGLRFCGPESGGVVFVTHHGIPECMPAKEDGSVICDLYLHGYGGGRSDYVLGKIELRPHMEGTKAILRVISGAAKKEAIMGAWEQFLRGNAKEVCP